MSVRLLTLGSYLASSLLISSLSLTAQADRNKHHPIVKPVFGCQQTSENENFVNFESGQVRPLALSEDGKLLFVANTPANCLEIYSTKGNKLTRISAVQVGMEPVSVAVRNNHEVWVVNHLSDSISIVDLRITPRVTRTLLVGDEPRDIVFAGPTGNRAFVTTAHRGQNHDTFKFEDLRTPGIGRADVFVFDANNLGKELGGTPETVISLFADTPRSLTVSSDGNTVYAAAFLSGNQTTTVAAQAVAGQKPGPHDSHEGVLAPATGLIVKYNGEAWVDELNQDWSSAVLFNLPDNDVFEIDASAEVPNFKKAYSHVGTTLFNMAINPVSGALYVSNTDARNEVRFEGPGTRSTTVRGHITENRITVINKGQVNPVHLNPHVDFSLPMGDAISANEKAKTLAQPTNMLVSKDGETLFVSAFGSNKVAVLSTAEFEKDGYVPNAADHINVPGGPTGLAMSNNGKNLYVYSRYDNVVSVINVKKQKVRNTTALYNPEPAHVKDGRKFLYDADYTSSNGTASCSSCHIFGDLDSLAWDLGNPDEEMHDNLLPLSGGNLSPLKSDKFHPLKGPMTTQTFRGMVTSGAMHWRGDRMGQDTVASSSQAEAAFKEFSGAMVGLVGRETELSTAEMQAFTDFALSITSQPNPVRNLDNTLTADQTQGAADYFALPVDGGFGTCNSCHALDKEKNFFGTDTGISGEGPFVSQDFKVAHLRNMYSKVGMFGSSYFTATHMGDQVRGFGYLHDGTAASVDDFLSMTSTFFWDNQKQQQNVTDFVMVFDTEHMPVLGQQVTLSLRSKSVASSRVDLLETQAKAGACELAASGLLFGKSYYGVMQADGSYAAKGFPVIKGRSLRKLSLIPTQQMTYTCMPVQTVSL
ncbi:MAG: hypothetical protein HRU20_22995 [Pseudomonadales bacterium]|nr:hypothetical protein [Pseudomonadales bacterium]